MSGEKSEGAVEAQEFVPAGAQVSIPQDNLSAGITEINVATESLWGYPEDFYEISSLLANQLNACINNQSELSTAVDFLFQQCIYVQNFQNTGARLCCFLVEHFKKKFTDQSNADFKAELLKRCQEEFTCKDSRITSEDGISVLIGFTVFMAELTNLLRVKNEVLPFLLVKVTDLLITLLKVQNDEAVKWIVNVLKSICAFNQQAWPRLLIKCTNALKLNKYKNLPKKLTECVLRSKLCGSILEHPNNTMKFNQFFSEIKEFLLTDTNAAKVHRNHRLNLLNMIELRAARWNVSEVEKLRTGSHPRVDYNPYANLTVAPSLSDDQSVIYEDEDVYVAYPGDGLSTAAVPEAAGQQFNSSTGDGGASGEGRDVHDLTDNLNSLGIEVVCDGESYIIERDDEMEPEIAEAFEEYMASREQRNS